MREIKFRAWDKEKKKMLFGAECGFMFEVEDGAVEYDFCDILNGPRFEVMQYTGIEDKKGVEICEGDIIKVETIAMGRWEEGKEIYEIKWIRGGFSRCYGEGNLPLWWLDEDTERLEVIGNIYENPELLKPAKK